MSLGFTCNGCAAVSSRLQQLERMIKSPVAWPAWFADIQQGVVEVETVCRAMGVPVETFWTVSVDGHQNNLPRAMVMLELKRRGWPATRIALIGRTTHRAVQRNWAVAEKAVRGDTASESC